MASKAILALTLLLAYFRLFFDGGFSAFIMGILCMYMYMYMYCTVCVSIYDSVYVNNFYALHKYACVFYDPPCPTVCDCLDSQINFFCVCAVAEGREGRQWGREDHFEKRYYRIKYKKNNESQMQ